MLEKECLTRDAGGRGQDLPWWILPAPSEEERLRAVWNRAPCFLRILCCFPEAKRTIFDKARERVESRPAPLGDPNRTKIGFQGATELKLVWMTRDFT